jgi:hypothetical protein
MGVEMENDEFDYNQINNYIDNSKYAPLVRALWKLEQNHKSRLGKLASLGSLIARPEQGLRKGFDLVVYATILKMEDQLENRISAEIIKNYNGCEAVGLKNLVNCKENKCDRIYQLSETLFNAYLAHYGRIFNEYEKSINDGFAHTEISVVMGGAYNSEDFLYAVKEIAKTSKPVIEIIAHELMQQKRTLWIGQRVFYRWVIEEIKKIPEKLIQISKDEAIEWYN